MSFNWWSSLSAVSRLLRKGEVTSSELVNLMVKRVEDLNPSLHALSDVLSEHARIEGLKADRLLATGDLLSDLMGVPMVIKDIIDTTPAVCSAGLPFLSDYRPIEDAVVVKRLRRSGAVILGVSATDPGAFGVRTPMVHHPQAPDHNVGGSSGGSGAALAAGFCFAALGTDSGGSIRIPSACCLVAGFKPTYGRISTSGVRPLAWSLDHVGPMARFVSDLSLIQHIMDPKFNRKLRKKQSTRIVGYDPNYYRDAIPAVQFGMSHVLKSCRDMNVEVREISLPDPDEVQKAHRIILCSESAAYHFDTFPGRLEEYPGVARELLEVSKGITGREYVKALRQRVLWGHSVDEIFKKVDFIMAPTLPVLAPRREIEKIEVGGVERSVTATLVRYTCLFDHTGNPVVSLPASVIGPGLGVSVQVVGASNHDADVVAFAGQLERALDLKVNYEISSLLNDG
jgi:aspartyl-tRNA(Asn)/glutamyl-tRNA(Gln) amidotransferase subunit A